MFNISVSFQPNVPVEHLVAANPVATLSGGNNNYAIVSNVAYTFVLFGDVYRYDGMTPDLRAFADALQDNTLNTAAYYGEYFWLMLDGVDSIRLMCDPFGQFPVCYYCDDAGDYHFFSQDDLSSLQKIPRLPSREVISRFIYQGRRSIGRTAFDGVNMLIPGYHYTLSAERGMIADYIMENSLHPQRFRSPYCALSLAIVNKIKYHDDIVLELSGGVESTSIAAVLSHYKNQKQIRCVTYYDDRCYSSNEVSHAKSVADFFGLPLEAKNLNTVLPFSPLPPDVPLHLIPSVYACQYRQHQAIADAYNKNTLFISGHGGDALYMAPPCLTLFVDVLFGRGIAAAVRTLYSVAIQHRAPILSLLIQALDKKNSRNTDPDDLYFISENRINRHLYPARKTQWQDLIGTLLEVMPLLNPVFTGKRLFYPFLSAPVVTQALHCPLDNLVHREFNRYALRKSVYLNTLCHGIWRTDKGDTTHNMLMGLAANARSVHTFLLEGQLASQGMIDLPGMIKTLQGAMLGRLEGLPLIGRFFAAETLLRAAG